MMVNSPRNPLGNPVRSVFKTNNKQTYHYEEDCYPRPYGRRFRVLPAAAAAADSSPGDRCSPAGGSCEGQVSDT